jgi:hypothetical protein
MAQTTNSAQLARREAYDKALESCSEKHKLLLKILGRYPNGLARSELATFSGLKLQTVCGRIAEMKELQVVRELDERRIIDGRSVSVLVTCEPPEPPQQPATFFDDQLADLPQSSYYRGGK